MARITRIVQSISALLSTKPLTHFGGVVNVVLLDDALHRGVFMARRNHELVGRFDRALIVSERELDRAGTRGIVALTHKRHRLVRRTTTFLFQLRAALVVVLERFLVLLGASKPAAAAIRTHAGHPIPCPQIRQPSKSAAPL
jgi:hypothetical protein